jgi:hypothetical protein
VRAVASNATAGAFAVGVRTSPLVTATERWISRVDVLGNTEWTVIEDSGFAEDVYHDLLVGPAGNVYAVGSVGTADNGGDLLVSAYDDEGALLWTWQHDHLGAHDELTAIGLSLTGELVVAGTVELTPGDADIVLATLDTDGAEVWLEVVDGGGNNDRIHDLAIDPQGKFVLVGSVCTPVYVACPTMHARKHDTDGAVMWVRTGAGLTFATGTSEARGVAVGADNQIQLVGSARQNLPDPMQPWVGSLSP